MGVRQRLPGTPVFREFAAPRMAPAARLHLAAFSRDRLKAGMRYVCRPVTLNPTDVARTRTVTRLAPNAHLRKGGMEAVLRRIVILAHACRVAFRAHVVPVLLRPSPVQRV